MRSYISNLRQQYKLDSIPSVFVASKSDLDLAVQRHEVQPDVYCRRLLLRPPVACNSRQTSVLWQVICSVGMRRGCFQSLLFCELTFSQSTANSSIPGGSEKQTTLLRPISYAVLGLAIVGVGCAIYLRPRWPSSKWFAAFRKEL
jgi:Ras family protein T1